jgi:hypothetical protein
VGFRISYLGAKCTPEAIAEHFDLAVTHTEANMPDGESWITRLSESGWSLLWAEEEEFVRTNSKLIKTLSLKAEVVACEVNETVMWSSAEYWRNGTVLWKVTHAGDGDGRYDVSASGALPDQYASIKQTHMDLQKGDDEVDFLFEIPLETASLHLGFRHDQVLDSSAVDYYRIFAGRRKRGFFSSLFGRT